MNIAVLDYLPYSQNLYHLLIGFLYRGVHQVFQLLVVFFQLTFLHELRATGRRFEERLIEFSTGLSTQEIANPYCLIGGVVSDRVRPYVKSATILLRIIL